MPAVVKLSELNSIDTVQIDFGFSGLTERHALSIIRDIIRDEWPEQLRPEQCVYSVRLVGDVAVTYPNGFSPVVYIGEGNAYNRLYQHTSWLAPLLLAVPQLSVEVRIVEIGRRNHRVLYQFIEADLIRWFSEAHGALPWFNRQRERSKEANYEYEPDARKALNKLISIGSGRKYLWAIQPTPNNPQHRPYDIGSSADA